MPQRPTRDAKQFYQAAAVLHVPDPRAAAEHYRDRLGFTLDFVMPDHGYAVVWRENAAVHFARAEAGTSARGSHLFFWVADVDALYAELKGRGATLITEPTTQPYGIRDFHAHDVGGTLLIFGQDAD